MAILDGPAGRWGPLATGAHDPLEQEKHGLALQRQLKMQVREGDGCGRAEEEAGGISEMGRLRVLVSKVPGPSFLSRLAVEPLADLHALEGWISV